MTRKHESKVTISTACMLESDSLNEGVSEMDRPVGVFEARKYPSILLGVYGSVIIIRKLCVGSDVILLIFFTQIWRTNFNYLINPH